MKLRTPIKDPHWKMWFSHRNTDQPILTITFQMKPFRLRKCSRHKTSTSAQYLIFVDIKTLVDQDKICFWEDFVVFHNNLEVCHIYNSEAEGEI